MDFSNFCFEDSCEDTFSELLSGEAAISAALSANRFHNTNAIIGDRIAYVYA
jgi:hypothetical protein